jgi:hypothetical protein
MDYSYTFYLATFKISDETVKKEPNAGSGISYVYILCIVNLII